MRSVFELEAGDLVSRLETKNSVLFQSLEKAFLQKGQGKVLVCSLVCWLSINGKYHLYQGF